LEPYVIKFDKLGMGDVEVVGGKNASLGEMICNLSGLGVDVPGGFATTAAAYREFLRTDDLDNRINSILDNLDVDDIEALTTAGKTIRDWIVETELPERLMTDIRAAWDEMSGGNDIAVAVRSSATAEDLPDASFAGQQETFLNVRGIDHLIEALHQVFASLFRFCFALFPGVPARCKFFHHCHLCPIRCPSAFRSVSQWSPLFSPGQ